MVAKRIRGDATTLNGKAYAIKLQKLNARFI